jgi:hypothetical protein
MRSVFRVLCALALFSLGPVLPSWLGLVSVASSQESVRVWVNTKSGVYHCPGSRYYGNTKAGEFMPEAAARSAGNRPAYGQSCGTGAAVAPERLSTQASVAPSSSEVKVWVNTRSGVYHCPATQYYGNTKSGEFMSESEARAAGNRPAYGRSCG